ncbi:hypothetical protein [Microbacterium hominis]|uniref:HTH luxR-type domain-containing protein n=1 Tax=Microbacterium hominis TaxID=162426 RepID=A0A7D4U9T4_9MICO|nr:hypothetical protein [Microbacterium hominis]QKJ20926.1 hypothetical protein HQM25_17215 [Microbacterium hominis]
MTRNPRPSPLDLLVGAPGLSEPLLRAYRTLVAASSADAAQLAAVLDATPDAAHGWLAELQRLGFVTALPVDPSAPSTAPRFVAVPPTVALGPTVAAHEEAVRRAQSELGRLEELYRNVSMEGGADDVVQVVRGADAVAQWFTRVQAGARREVCAFVQHPVAVTSADQNAVEDELVARGVQYRVLLERPMLEEHPGGLDGFAASLAAGEQARVVDALPLRMILVDREVAFMPVLSDRERAFAAALVVRPSALLTGLSALFDALWATAAPVVLDASVADPAVGVTDDLDARLLSLLLAGQTDEAAASYLGVSLRTVQRRARELMDRAGVRTRMQLGWHAARAGWNAGPGPSPSTAHPAP